MTQLETRSIELEYREDTEAEEGFIEGYAVRYGEIADIGGKYRESFARGAFAGSEDVKLYRDHRELIGHVVETEDREDGFWIRARVALTDLGRNTLALLRSGALNRFSVGFVPRTHRDEDGVLVRTAALLREVSVVERPAYAGAHILAVREESTSEGDNKMTNNVTSADIVEVRNSIEELDRKIETSLSTRAVEEPVADQRSAAAFVTAIAKEDESTIRSYNEVQTHVTDELMTRAYTGGTTANAPMQNQWVGDLTRIFDSSSSILSETFSRGTLPAKGNVLEYAKLDDTSGTVTEQVNEGDALSYMSVSLTTDTTTVHTYGGYTSLSFQAIERSTLPVLQRTLEHMAIQAGVNKKAVLRADFDKVVADRRAIAANGGVILGGAALASMDAAKWLTAILAANRRFKAQGYTVDKLIVTEDVFAHLVGLTTSGDRVLRVAEGNSAGTANIRGLSASLFGVPVEVDDSPSASAATGQAVFVNGAAIRQYDSAVVSLQDSDIIHLTKDFSVYRYGAIADEQPSLIIPVKFAAS